MLKNYKTKTVFNDKLKIGGVGNWRNRIVSILFLLFVMLGNVFAQAPNDCGVPGTPTSSGGGTFTNLASMTDRTAGYKTTALSLTGPFINTFGTTMIAQANFNTADAGDSVNIIVAFPTSLNVSVLSSITVQAYNGATAVGTAQTLQSLLTAFNITQSSTPTPLGFIPGGTFNNVRFTANLGAGISLGAFFEVYDVAILPTSPQSLDNSYCLTSGSTNTTVSVKSPDESSTGLNLTYYWYASATTTTVSGTTTKASPDLAFATAFPTLAASAGTKTVYVTTSKTSCTNDTSLRVPVSISVTTCTILPAIGFTLNGLLVSAKPVLTWTTLQEHNTSYFSIEASPDGTNFSSIGKVSAAGSSNSATSYSFTDATSVGSLVYYRIKLVDLDGLVSYSNIFTLRISGISSAKIYPNPVTNILNVETGASGTYVAELFTVDGKKLSSTTLSTTTGLVTLSIDRANVPSGIYLLKMSSKIGSSSTYNTIMVK